jgi:hypothetical protein
LFRAAGPSSSPKDPCASGAGGIAGTCLREQRLGDGVLGSYLTKGNPLARQSIQSHGAAIASQPPEKISALTEEHCRGPLPNQRLPVATLIRLYSHPCLHLTRLPAKLRRPARSILISGRLLCDTTPPPRTPASLCSSLRNRHLS